MCKEWTKLFNETNLLYLDIYKEVKEKCNEDRVGVSGAVEIDEYWNIPYPVHQPTGRPPSFRTLVTTMAKS